MQSEYRIISLRQYILTTKSRRDSCQQVWIMDEADSIISLRSSFLSNFPCLTTLNRCPKNVASLSWNLSSNERIRVPKQKTIYGYDSRELRHNGNIDHRNSLSWTSDWITNSDFEGHALSIEEQAIEEHATQAQAIQEQAIQKQTISTLFTKETGINKNQ